MEIVKIEVISKPRRLSAEWSVEPPDSFIVHRNIGRFYKFSKWMSKRFPRFWTADRVVKIRKKFNIWSVEEEISELLVNKYA